MRFAVVGRDDERRTSNATNRFSRETERTGRKRENYFNAMIPMGDGTTKINYIGTIGAYVLVFDCLVGLAYIRILHILMIANGSINYAQRSLNC